MPGAALGNSYICRVAVLLSAPRQLRFLAKGGWNASGGQGLLTRLKIQPTGLEHQLIPPS